MAHARGPWSSEEDDRLRQLVGQYGASNWVKISKELRTRSPKQCRERWHQNLKPGLNLQPITEAEGREIERLYAEYGPRWADIARSIGNRSDNAIKNWWNGGVNRRKRRDTKQLQATSASGPQRTHQSGLPQHPTTHRYAPYPQQQQQQQHQQHHIALNAQVDPRLYHHRTAPGRFPSYPPQQPLQNSVAGISSSLPSSSPSSSYPVGFEARLEGMPQSYHPGMDIMQQQQQHNRRMGHFKQRQSPPPQVPSLSPDCGSASSHDSQSSAGNSQPATEYIGSSYGGAVWHDGQQSSYGNQPPSEHADSSYGHLGDGPHKAGHIGGHRDPHDEVQWSPYERQFHAGAYFHPMHYQPTPAQMSSYYQPREQHASSFEDAHQQGGMSPRREDHDMGKRTPSAPMSISNLLSH